MMKAVRIEPFGQEGFAVTYPSCDASTIEALRAYQAQVRQRGGWFSRLDFTPGGGCRVSVFPLDELPAAVLGGQRRAW